MTLRQLLEYTDAVRPNGYTFAQKGAWVSDLEATLWTQIFLRPAGEWQPYEGENSAQKRLLLPPVWRKVYAAYLGAMLDYANGEYTLYANSMSMYNACVGELGAWYAQMYDPASRPAVWARLGTVAYTGAEDGAVPLGRLPENVAVLAAECRIRESFDGDGSFLLGEENDHAALMGDMDITREDVGVYRRLGLYLPSEEQALIFAQYTGSAPTQGTAEFRILLQPCAK